MLDNVAHDTLVNVIIKSKMISNILSTREKSTFFIIVYYIIDNLNVNDRISKYLPYYNYIFEWHIYVHTYQYTWEPLIKIIHVDW